MDKDTERFFKSRMEPLFEVQKTEVDIIEKEKGTDLAPYIDALPLLELRAAADASYEHLDGYFSDGANYNLVPVRGGPFPKDRFLVRAEGDSMEPKIPNGSLCLFRKDPGGSRNGKIVLCRIEGFAGDAPLAVIKRYQSKRVISPDSIGEAEKIVLSSLNPTHKPIEITEGDEFSILGIFERVI